MHAVHQAILLTYTVPKAIDDFIVNNEKKKHSSYGMKSFNPYDECFLHFKINNEIIQRFWDSVLISRSFLNFEFLEPRA
jgi:hypothetical protein